jgi:ABC-type protease/lipase transport system fused ATPase/permease subunit
MDTRTAEGSRYAEARASRVSLRGMLFLIGLVSSLRNLVTIAISIIVMLDYSFVRWSQSARLFTLLFGAIIAFFVLQGVLRLVRLRMLRRLVYLLDERYSAAACRSAFANPANDVSAFQNLNTIREFILGNGLVILFDFPWAVLFAVFLMQINLLIGIAALAFASLVGFVAVLERRSSALVVGNGGNPYIAMLSRGHGVYRSFMTGARFTELFDGDRRRMMEPRHSATRTKDFLRIASTTLRSIQRIVMLGLAAYLTSSSPGSVEIMIVSALLAPGISDSFDILTKSWPQILAARLAWQHVRRLEVIEEPDVDETRHPVGGFVVEQLAVIVPDGAAPILSGISFSLQPGEILLLRGATSTGKTSLANTLAGCWPPRSGHALLDGVNVQHLSDSDRVALIGYFPQANVVYPGTMAENIARFAEPVDRILLVRALGLAGLERAVADHADGTQTELYKIFHLLSPGIRRRIGLARALYGYPTVLIFDEPFADLDADAQKAAIQALQAHRKAGGMSIILTADTSPLSIATRSAEIRSDGLVMVDSRVGDAVGVG